MLPEALRPTVAGASRVGTVNLAVGWPPMSEGHSRRILHGLKCDCIVLYLFKFHTNQQLTSKRDAMNPLVTTSYNLSFVLFVLFHLRHWSPLVN